MEVKEKKSKKEIWKEFSLEFLSLCCELWCWCFPKGTNLEPIGKIQKKKVGMFYYAEDKSFSEELIPNKKVSGVVYHVNRTGEHGLVVLLHQKELQWLNWSLCVGVPEGEIGKENTRLILEFAQRHGLRAEAAEYCANYTYDGVKAGEAFLPSIDELKYLYQNKQLVDEKLALIDGADLLDGWYYWSSSECPNFNSAMSQCFRSGRVFGACNWKCSRDSVRPVLAF